MKGKIVRTVVFFVLITVILISMVGTWRIITMEVFENSESDNNMFLESTTGAGYVNIIINQEENQENE